MRNHTRTTDRLPSAAYGPLAPDLERCGPRRGVDPVCGRNARDLTSMSRSDALEQFLMNSPDKNMAGAAPSPALSATRICRWAPGGLRSSDSPASRAPSARIVARRPCPPPSMTMSAGFAAAPARPCARGCSASFPRWVCCCSSRPSLRGTPGRPSTWLCPTWTSVIHGQVSSPDTYRLCRTKSKALRTREDPGWPSFPCSPSRSSKSEDRTATRGHGTPARTSLLHV